MACSCQPPIAASCCFPRAADCAPPIACCRLHAADCAPDCMPDCAPPVARRYQLPIAGGCRLRTLQIACRYQLPIAVAIAAQRQCQSLPNANANHMPTACQPHSRFHCQCHMLPMAHAAAASPRRRACCLPTLLNSQLLAVLSI
jgi:hypothetical protein